jgi:predicted MFS family arabinose efflux permease
VSPSLPPPPRARNPYRRLFARKHARRLAVACAGGWFSFASYAIALVLTVEHASGSFASAGLAVAGFSVGSGLLAPLRGRAVDVRGPRGLLLFLPPHVLALLWIAWGAANGGPTWAFVVAAGIAGASAPPLVATARSIWPGIAGPDLTGTAHATNAALGDAGQVVGPVATVAIAAALNPSVALGLLATTVTLSVVVVCGFARPDGGQEAPPRRRGLGVLRESPGLQLIVVCELGAGVFFGALDVIGPALAGDEHAGLASLPLAAFAFGSVLASLWTGARTQKHTSTQRYVWGSAWLATFASVVLVTPTLGGATAALAVAGIGYGLLNVAVFELIETVVPVTAVVEAFTWLTTWQGIGLAIGATVAGHAVDVEMTGAVGLMAGAAVATAIIAFLWRGRLRGEITV